MARGGAASSVILVVAVLLGFVGLSMCFNITDILATYPDYSQLNDWFTRTGVAGEINNRSSITVLAPNNAVLGAYLGTVPNAYTEPDTVGDTLRYHVLLTYFGYPQLAQLPANGTSVTTLLQTTGRANQSQGFVTLYNNGTAYLVGHEYIDAYGNETILSNVIDAPYSYSILQVSSILSPAAPSPVPSPAPSPLSKAPSPAPTTVTKTPPAQGPARSQTTSPNHASTKCMSKLLVILAMLFGTVVAWL